MDRATTTDLYDREQTLAWELRKEWARGRSVRLTLSDRCMVRTVTGKVEQVAVTGAFVVVAGWHIPVADIVALGQKHFHQDSGTPTSSA